MLGCVGFPLWSFFLRKKKKKKNVWLSPPPFIFFFFFSQKKKKKNFFLAHPPPPPPQNETLFILIFFLFCTFPLHSCFAEKYRTRAPQWENDFNTFSAYNSQYIMIFWILQQCLAKM